MKIFAVIDVAEQRFGAAVGQVHAPNRDRHHLGARRAVRVRHHRVGRILARADDQPRAEGLVGDGENVCAHGSVPCDHSAGHAANSADAPTKSFHRRERWCAENPFICSAVSASSAVKGFWPENLGSELSAADEIHDLDLVALVRPRRIRTCRA